MAKPPRSAHTKLRPPEIAKRRARVVEMVEQLPEARAARHGTHLSPEVRGKRFGWYLQDHHGDGRLALNCRAQAGTNAALARETPDWFHVPKYVGHHGWVGVWLDLPQTDWSAVQSVLTEAYRITVPKSLVAQLRSEDRRERPKGDNLAYSPARET